MGELRITEIQLEETDKEASRQKPRFFRRVVSKKNREASKAVEQAVKDKEVVQKRLVFADTSVQTAYSEAVDSDDEQETSWDKVHEAVGPKPADDDVRTAL